MRLNVWPACIECHFIKLEDCTCYSSKRDCLGELQYVKTDAIECIHAPVCSLIKGQKQIEGESDAPMA